VHHRCDPESQSIIKTIETIVEQSDRKPRQRCLRPGVAGIAQSQ
jgi:hypothetical protein